MVYIEFILRYSFRFSFFVDVKTGNKTKKERL